MHLCIFRKHLPQQDESNQTIGDQEPHKNDFHFQRQQHLQKYILKQQQLKQRQQQLEQQQIEEQQRQLKQQQLIDQQQLQKQNLEQQQLKELQLLEQLQLEQERLERQQLERQQLERQQLERQQMERQQLAVLQLEQQLKEELKVEEPPGKVLKKSGDLNQSQHQQNLNQPIKEEPTRSPEESANLKLLTIFTPSSQSLSPLLGIPLLSHETPLVPPEPSISSYNSHLIPPISPSSPYIPPYSPYSPLIPPSPAPTPQNITLLPRENSYSSAKSDSSESQNTPISLTKRQECSIPFLVKQTLADYNLAYTQLDISDTLVGHLGLAHLNVKNWSQYHSNILMNILHTFRQLMIDFAKRSYIFKSLCCKDQRMLLKKNVELFRQYILARYLASSTGLDQLNILLGPNLPILGKNLPPKVVWLNLIIIQPP